MDKIALYGIECRCRIGVPAAERRRAQKILIDVQLEIDISSAAVKDDFRLTADYAEVERYIREVAQTGERQLVERLAVDLAAEVLRREPRVAAVIIAVHKSPAAMPKTREVVVEIRRARR